MAKKPQIALTSLSSCAGCAAKLSQTILREVYPSLSLEKIYATILYYEANKVRIEEYIRRGDEVGDQYYREYLQQPETVPLADLLRQARLAGARRARDCQNSWPRCRTWLHERCLLHDGSRGATGLA